VSLEEICVNHPRSPPLQLCPAFVLCPEDREEGDEMSKVASKDTSPVELSSSAAVAKIHVSDAELRTEL